MEHWFLSFLWRRDDSSSWRPVEAVTRGEHALDYVARMRAANPAYDFVVVSFQPITEDVYLRVTERL